MSKKRTSAESSNDEHTNEDGSDSIFQEDDDAKRSKLDTLHDTTLQDLPIELLEFILIKAVAMEVLELKVARFARKEQADLVIERLRTVCPQWNCVLTTDIFRKEVHKLLEGKDTNRFEILDQPSFHVNVSKLTTLNNEIFLLCQPPNGCSTLINVYDRNNMAELKDFIPLVLGMFPVDLAACTVSNCVYILNRQLCYIDSPAAVFRIKKDEEPHFKVSPWINNRALPFPSRGPMSVASNGNLVILSSQETSRAAFYAGLLVPGLLAKMACVSIFDAIGSLQHTIMLSPDAYGFRIINSVIQKADGNLVLLAVSNAKKEKLLEIDTNGRILRQYQSSHSTVDSVMSFAEVYGRILVTNDQNRIQVFDTHLNPLEISDPQPPNGFIHAPEMHFDSERNEMVRIETLKYVNYGFRVAFEGSVLSFFRFTSA